ncbi:MAG: hypothetical protein JM58_00615 [Peptococcaceae bacterium BICA1-8]|nr:MAG: hypothetical protein JM58_00615 [Peptococcaceae bacterium BICA1-8]
MSRGLSDKFMYELKFGLLFPFLNLVIVDSTICLEIREESINLYYRGGNILRIKNNKGNFFAFFDRGYLDEATTNVPVLPEELNNPAKVDQWIKCIPHIKHEMDLWFTKSPKSERAAQQITVQENNLSDSATGTDYFICDIEYANKNGRFDMIAVHWSSSSSSRKNDKDIGLSFIEMKYMDKALSGPSGLAQHIFDINNFLTNPRNLIDLKEEMKTVFNQKLELGLIRNQKRIVSFNDKKPEIIIAIANHDPDSTILKDVMLNLQSNPLAEVKFAVSNFMGYGLYQDSLYTVDQFLNKFRNQICTLTG